MIYFILTLLFFSSMEVVSKPFMGHINPFIFTFYRFFIGFFFLLIFVLIRHRDQFAKITRKDYIIMALLGFLNVFFSMSMLQMAVHHGTAATAAAILCSNPLFVLIIGFIIGQELFCWRKLLYALIGVGGVFVMMFGRGLELNVGALYALVASVTFALYTVINKQLVARNHPIVINVVSFFFGLLSSMVYFLISGKNPMPPEYITSSVPRMLAILYLGVGVSAIGYITFFYMLRKLSAVSSSLIFFLKPAVATIMAVFILSERPGLDFFIGLALMSLGSAGFLIPELKKKRQKKLANQV